MRPRGHAGLVSDFKLRHYPIVGFQDPDDLLGYKASDAVFTEAKNPLVDNGVTFIDIVHRNTPQWLFILAAPGGAHDHELQEAHSLQMILCGARVHADGSLKAKRPGP